MKENQNTLEYNVWSGGEYKNSLEDIPYIGNAITAKTSNNYSSIGENSIHLQTLTSSSGFFMISNQQYTINTVLTAKVHIRCIKGSVRFRIDDGGSNIISSTTISENMVDDVSISGTIPSTGSWRLQLVVSGDTEVYVDNISLKTS